jgi:hypothetical protein
MDCIIVGRPIDWIEGLLLPLFFFFFHSRYVVNLKRLCTLSQTSEQPALQSAKITEKKKNVYVYSVCYFCMSVCLRLVHKPYTGSKLSFKVDKFQRLRFLCYWG